MLFGKVKRIISQLGPAVENSLRPPFAMTIYLQDGSFSPPPDIWKDPYVQGFITAQTLMMLDFGFDGKSLSIQKRGEVMIGVYTYVAKDHSRELMDRALGQMKLGLDADPEFSRGHRDGSTLVGAAFGILRHDDPDPVLNQARDMAESIRKDSAWLTAGDTTDESSLAAAVSSLTISRHIKDKYLSDLA